jgi:phage gpG-like protein
MGANPHMIEVKSSLKAVKALIAKLDRKIMPIAIKAGAAKDEQLVQMEFRQSKDPYGKPWAPLKLRKGKPLRDTGRLANSFSGRPTSSGIKVGTNVRYATTHQYGATIRPRKARGVLAFKVRGGKRWYFATKVKIPARAMLPKHGLGQWQMPIRKAMISAVQKHLYGK